MSTPEQIEKLPKWEVNLDKLTHQQLIALGKQKTDIPYRELVKTEREKLVAQLSKVKGIMTPVQT
jgi:hypothetical protein